MGKAHDRIVELVFVADDSSETVVVSEVNYFRVPEDTKYALKFTQTSPNTTGTLLVLGELMPPPTHIKLTFTVQA
jgi:hypothetical protein